MKYFKSTFVVNRLTAMLSYMLFVMFVSASSTKAESETVSAEENDNPVCDVGGLKKLHSNLLKLVGNRAPQQGWDLTKAMVCFKGPEADKIVRRYITGDLMMRIGGPSGGQDYAVAKQSDELHNGYGRGNAWHATVELQGNDIWVNFMADEICWKGFTLRFDGKKWNIFELNSGCD
ncbi:hypothetical protein [Sapientia aquatica]|uniref:Uncharacterized protein n=1 Tax=Sapientia aquatica TaxID=1549640 RepID=A0A4R5W201_9BURK|nr:hypothetical protein [Sapientia aquatica]TDK66395.1 hypothetical protein E2I14_07935 [Sapientia aquatica]